MLMDLIAAKLDAPVNLPSLAHFDAYSNIDLESVVEEFRDFAVNTVEGIINDKHELTEDIQRSVQSVSTCLELKEKMDEKQKLIQAHQNVATEVKTASKVLSTYEECFGCKLETILSTPDGTTFSLKFENGNMYCLKLSNDGVLLDGDVQYCTNRVSAIVHIKKHLNSKINDADFIITLKNF